MTKIECILRPNKILEVKDALGNIGCGLQKGHTDIDNWDNEFDITLLSKTKIEMVVMDEMVDNVVKVIIKAVRTGEFGDGKIFTYPIGNAIRIRTGETGEDAI